jgi:hypothetical protein
MAHVNSKDMFPIIVTPMAAMKYENSDSSRHRFQDICQPISQIVLKNFIKIWSVLYIIKLLTGKNTQYNQQY